MKVDSVDNGAWSTGTTRLERDHVVQDVFSAVLAEAGREGYASAEAVSEEAPMTDQISASWSSWFNGECREGRYRDEAAADSLKQAYGEILLQAYQEGGYADPKAFLETLSGEELSAVQVVHRLADPIRVDSLTEEGALNLLVPPAAQVDLNHDGLTRSGVAYGMKFPDSNTPAAVAEAWEEATDGMDLKERMIYELHMMLPLLTANIICDDEGRFVKQYGPDDPEFRNPMASSDYSYVEATEDRLEYLEAFKTRISPEQYEREKTFWTKFQNLLIDHGAP